MISNLLTNKALKALGTESKSIMRLFAPGVCLLLGALSGFSQASPSVTLAWDPCSTPDIIGHRLYMGTTSQVYTNTFNLGVVTNATVTGLNPGVTYYFAVTALSSNGLESPYSSEVSYTAPLSALPTIALTSPANNAGFVAPATINLAAGVVANGHTITKVQFFNGITLLGESTTAPYAFTWNNVSAGSYGLNAQAVYDAGSTVSSGTANITVSALPTIALTSPANNASFAAPATINLAAGVVANGHTITKVQFFNGTTLLGESATAPYAFGWNNVSAGSYSLNAQVVYDAGSTVSSGTANVMVSAPATTNTISFAASSGTITSPFTVNNGIVSQSVETGVTNGGRAAYSFTVAVTGDYLVSANVYAPSDAENSFYVNIDAEPADPTMIWDCAVTSNFVSQTVSWRGNGTVSQSQFVPKVFNLTQGTHQLIVRGREANTQLGTITISPAAALPLPWQVVDLGRVGITGSASATNGLFTVAGGGNLSGSADGFRFLYQPMTGNGEVRAQINSIQATNLNARVGVMIRETLTAGSRYAFMGISPDGKLRSQRRSTTGGSTSSSATGSGTMPNVWTRVVRTNNTFYSYQSVNGVNWTRGASASMTMATNVYAGLAVASGSTNAVSASAFTNVVFVP